MKYPVRWLADAMLVAALAFAVSLTVLMTPDAAGFTLALIAALLATVLGTPVVFGLAHGLRNGPGYPVALGGLLGNLLRERAALLRITPRSDSPAFSIRDDLLTEALEAHESGHQEMARRRLIQLLARTPSMTNAWVNLARVELASNRPHRALAAIDMALLVVRPDSAFNNNGQIFVQKARILARLGRLTSAAGLLDTTVIGRFPLYRRAVQLRDACRSGSAA